MKTFCNGVRLAKMGGEFEFCPGAWDRNIDVGTVSVKKMEFCPTDVLCGILDDADYI